MNCTKSGHTGETVTKFPMAIPRKNEPVQNLISYKYIIHTQWIPRIYMFNIHIQMNKCWNRWGSNNRDDNERQTTHCIVASQVASEASFANDYRFTNLPEFLKRYETKVDGGLLTFSTATNIFEDAYTRILLCRNGPIRTDNYWREWDGRHVSIFRRVVHVVLLFVCEKWVTSRWA